MRTSVMIADFRSLETNVVSLSQNNYSSLFRVDHQELLRNNTTRGQNRQEIKDWSVFSPGVDWMHLKQQLI